MMATSSFRDFIPPPRNHPRLGDIDFKDYDVYSWAQWGMNQSFVKDLWENWQRLYAEPFRGITATGQVEPDLYRLRSENVPVKAMCAAAQHLLTVSDEDYVSNKMRYAITANEWRCWMNPEFYFARYGIRLEEHSPRLREAVLSLIQSSLSEKGYEKVLNCMRINAFLGDLVHARHLMNEGSYNFILFGEPSIAQPWGWSIWGHHLSLCVFVLADQMVVSPCFFGCEPRQIDTGPFAGVEVFSEQMHLAIQLMKTLSPGNCKTAILFDDLEHPDLPAGLPHPADGRNLAGAYEDNRIIPHGGVQVSQFSPSEREALLKLIECTLDFLPEGPLGAKMGDVMSHLDRTSFLWIGGYSENDPFHFRIHSPVLIYEFDNECGMYLTNTKPGRFHVHTVVRTPNGNDYGKELLRLWEAT